MTLLWCSVRFQTPEPLPKTRLCGICLCWQMRPNKEFASGVESNLNVKDKNHHNGTVVLKNKCIFNLFLNSIQVLLISNCVM